jgi:drug/metabolite transporter (DMT)-like permease
MMIVGSSVVVGKIITASFPLFLASGLRFGVAALLLAFLVSSREKALTGLGRKDWITLVLMAVCGQFLFTLFLLWGLRMTSAAEAGVITSTTPAAMAVVSCLLLKERLTLTNVVGVGLAVLGILAVNGLLIPTTGDHGPYRWLGNLLVCSAVVGKLCSSFSERR